jgi:hypothetical protein
VTPNFEETEAWNEGDGWKVAQPDDDLIRGIDVKDCFLLTKLSSTITALMGARITDSSPTRISRQALLAPSRATQTPLFESQSYLPQVIGQVVGST